VRTPSKRASWPRRGEGGDDEFFRGRGVEVADGDDGQLLRAVPGVPEFREPLAGRVRDDLLQADGNALGQERAGQHELELRDKGAEAHVVAGALLAQDDAALLVDLGRLQQEAAGIIGEHPHALGERGLVGLRQLEQVLRAVEAGEGVRVAAEAHAHALEELDERARRVVRAAVEGHVLEEVREAALVLALMERAGLDDQAQRGPALRLLVGIDDVADAIGQPAEARRRVGRQVAGLVGKGRGGGQPDRQEQGGEEAKAGDHGRDIG